MVAYSGLVLRVCRRRVTGRLLAPFSKLLLPLNGLDLDGWCLHLIMMVSRVCPLCAARSLPVGAVGGGSATLPILLALLALPGLLLVVPSSGGARLCEQSKWSGLVRCA